MKTTTGTSGRNNYLVIGTSQDQRFLLSVSPFAALVEYDLLYLGVRVRAAPVPGWPTAQIPGFAPVDMQMELRRAFPLFSTCPHYKVDATRASFVLGQVVSTHAAPTMVQTRSSRDLARSLMCQVAHSSGMIVPEELTNTIGSLWHRALVAVAKDGALNAVPNATSNATPNATPGKVGVGKIEPPEELPLDGAMDAASKAITDAILQQLTGKLGGPSQ